MSHVITDPAQITASYLTEVLRRSGALEHGEVANFTTDMTDRMWSKITGIRLEYSADARGERPASLLLKLCAGTFGRSEIDYLTRDYAGVAQVPIPRCYDAAYDETIPAYHLLLQDLSATHESQWEIAPTLAYGKELAEALARLHAAYWGQTLAPEPAAAAIDRYFGHITQGLEALLELTDGAVPEEWRAAVRHVFAVTPQRMQARFAQADGITMVHGDVNPGNVLAPKHGEGAVYLIDRQPFDWSLTTWLGTGDFGYGVALWWPSELRREFEQPILRHYLATLQELGVESYTWEQLWDDYRLCVMQCFHVPVEWCVVPEDRERMRWLWMQQLERAYAVYQDLRCFEL